MPILRGTMNSERTRFESLLHGRTPSDNLFGGGKLKAQHTSESRFKTKLNSSSVSWRHGDARARVRCSLPCLDTACCTVARTSYMSSYFNLQAILRSPGHSTWQSDALGRRDTLAPCAVSVVNRAFDRSYLPCTPPHKGRLRVGMYHTEQPSSPSSLRRGAIQDTKPALAVGHTKRFASHKAHALMSPSGSRESSPTRSAPLVHPQSFLPGSPANMFQFGHHKRMQPAAPTYRDVLSNAVNKPRHVAWGFSEVKPQVHRQNANRMSLQWPLSEGTKTMFSVSNLVGPAEAPPSTVEHTRARHHSPTAGALPHPLPPSTAPAGRVRSNSFDPLRHSTPNFAAPAPERIQPPQTAARASDDLGFRQSTLETQGAGASAQTSGMGSVNRAGASLSNSDRPGTPSCPVGSESMGSPLNPKAQPFMPQKSKLGEAGTPSHPIATTVNGSPESPQPTWNTPGLSSHPCMDSDIQLSTSSASPNTRLHSPELGAHHTSPALNLCYCLTLSCDTRNSSQGTRPCVWLHTLCHHSQ